MADVTASTINHIQNYGGVKATYFEATVTAADVLVFTDNEISDITLVVMQDADGVAVSGAIGSSSGTLLDEVTVGAGPVAELVHGIIYWQNR